MPKYTLEVTESKDGSNRDIYILFKDGKEIIRKTHYSTITEIMDNLMDFENRYSDEKSEFVNKVKGK